METTTRIIDSLTWRRATQKFDTTKKVTGEDLKTILQSANLSPSSYGLEPWKFIVVTDEAIRTQLRAAGYDQPKITEASHLIVIARRTDGETVSSELLSRTAASQGKTVEDLSGLKHMLNGAFANKTEGQARDGWFASQTYIALGIMIETASLLGIDNGPMEGFDAAKVGEILGLPEKNLFAVSMLALGYRAHDEQLNPKVRREYTDVVEFV